MITFFEASLNLMASIGGNPALAARMRATIAWVRASCAAEGLPGWCTETVVRRFEALLLAGEITPLLDCGQLPPVRGELPGVVDK